MDIGARLRHAREARGLTIDALSRSTRVQPRVLSAIEQNDSLSLPPRPYGRGFVRAYASEVGLDPDGTVREFFSQFAIPDAMPVVSEGRTVDVPRSTATARPWFWPVGAVAAYAAVGMLVILAGRWAMQSTAEPGAVATSGATVPAAAAAVERHPAPAPVPLPAPAAVDGRRTIYRILQPGERVNLTAASDVTIRAGDAGALTWQVNGRAAVRMGESGKVRNVRVTPENAATVK
jgi:cytoskeletal protein RodZ